MSLMDLPEQMSSTMEEEEDDVAHSLRAYPELIHLGLILHTNMSEASFLLAVETAEPQTRSPQAAAASFRVQSEYCTGLHSPSFTSSVPAQRLAPPTNLTGSDSILRSPVNTVNVSHLKTEYIQYIKTTPAFSCSVNTFN